MILCTVAVGIVVVGFSIYAILNKTETKQKHIDQYQLKELCFIGVGGGGCNILEDISQIDPQHTFIHLNSDLQALQAKTSQYKILLGHEDKAGLGCGGKTACGAKLVNSSTKKQLFSLTKPFDEIYVITTLGGGVGSGATAKIIEYLNTLGKKVFVAVTIPFSFEGKKRYDTAQYSLKELQNINKDIIVVENDAVMHTCQSDMLGTKESFQYLSKDIYQGIIDAIKSKNQKERMH